jgi:predicted DsbA family dithiol-disulfide isomerase
LRIEEDINEGVNMKSPQTVSVEIVLDIACVWSYLGYTRFSRVVSELREQGASIDVTFVPFQVDPRASFEGEPVVEVIKRNFGSVDAAEKSGSDEFAGPEGVEIDITTSVHANTLRAHALIANAAEQGLAEPMVARLFRAYHAEGRNVGDLDALASLAAEVGVTVGSLDTGAVQQRVAQVRQAGVHSVPLFVVNGRPAVSGSASQARFRETLTTAAA